MSTRTHEDVAEYVEWQCHGKSKVLSAKPEHEFNDLGYTVTVWNVKTDNEGDWWVVEGETLPMNFYPQHAYYFSADEVYSFHIGLMARLKKTEMEKPETFVESIVQGTDIAPEIYRKLKHVSQLLNSAVNVEEFQSIGMACRESLIELGNSIYLPEMASDEEERPKKSDFKCKAKLFIDNLLPGSENADYRNYIKKLSEITWEYANKITHSTSSTVYEASICGTLAIATVAVFENIRMKNNDPLSEFECPVCKSRCLDIINEEIQEDILIKITLKCKECETEIPINID